MTSRPSDRLRTEAGAERRPRPGSEPTAEHQHLEPAPRWDEVRFFERLVTITAEEAALGTAMQRLLDLACHHLDWPLGHIFLLNGSGTLESSGTSFVADPLEFAPLRAAWDERSHACSGLAARALASGGMVLVPDLRDDPAVLRDCPEALRRMQSGFALPIQVGADAIGVMEFFAIARACPDSRQLELLGHLSRQLGLTIARHAAAREIESERHRAEERVLTLTAQLSEGKDAAEDMAKAKAGLLATMTHELRTPLSAVHGMASLLLDSDLSESQRDHACHILSSTEALLSIVDEVLDYSRVESGRLQIEDVDFDPVALVDDVLTLLGSRAADKRIELASSIDPSVPAVVGGDPGRVRQILINLVGNALKFTETGHVLVRVALLTDREAGGADLRFEVEDTGIGVPAEVVPHLFQPFVQADASMSRLFGGSGLGLSICRRFAEALGGAIGVTSAPDAGSTFWFTVHATRHSGRFLAESNQLAGTRVLVMTRSEIVQSVAAQVLHTAGASVAHARTSGEAVRLARAGPTPFDAALVDLQQREARATAGGVSFHALLGESCRVIALAHPWNRPNDSSHEFDAVVTTPIRHRALQASVSRLLGRAVAAAPERAPADRFDGDLVGLNVLLVDDSDVNLKVASTFLAKFGCQWVTASNGREAVEAVARQTFDVVLMDCQMPEMDGFEATRAIRAMHGRATLPIVAMTANVDPGVREHCLEAGMTDYLVKPVRPSVLAEALLRRTAGASAA